MLHLLMPHQLSEIFLMEQPQCLVCVGMVEPGGSCLWEFTLGEEFAVQCGPGARYPREG